MKYLTIAEAREMRGLRLVLSAGVPGPWGESAKAVLNARKVPFVPVAQTPMGANDELHAWTGLRNAPIAILDDEPPLAGWLDILFLAERLGSGPSLLPETSADRALCLGYAAEICGQDGFGWNRRLSMIRMGWGVGSPADAAPELREFLVRYGVAPAAAARAPARTADILRTLAARLQAQRARGSAYLVGDRPSAVDLYWACFSQMVGPLPPEVNPIPEAVLSVYTQMPPEVSAALDPILFEHRDRIYAQHIGLPLDY